LTPSETLGQPLKAFPSWFLKIPPWQGLHTPEVHAPDCRREMPIHSSWERHEGCGRRAGGWSGSRATDDDVSPAAQCGGVVLRVGG
jgi:hypothetical protein